MSSCGVSEPAECLALINDEDIGITHLLCVPAHFLFMSQVPAFEDATFSPPSRSAAWGAHRRPLH